MVDESTTNKSYPLVNPSNIAKQDVARLATAIGMIDSDIAACEDDIDEALDDLEEIQLKVIKIPDNLENFDTELKNIAPGQYVTINATGDGFTTVEGGGGSGGNAGDVLIKNSNRNFDTKWIDSRSLIKRSMKVSEVSTNYEFENSDSVVLNASNETQISNEPRLELSTRQAADNVIFDANTSIILNDSVESDSGEPSNIASKTEFGRVIIGSGITVSNGVISVPEKPVATTTSTGVVKIGDNINVENGVISLDEPPLANTTTAGVVKLSNDFTLGDNNELLFAGALGSEPVIYGFSTVAIVENDVIALRENCARYRAFINKDTEFTFDFSGFVANRDIAFDLEIIADRDCLISFEDVTIDWILPCVATSNGTTVIHFEKKVGIDTLTATLKSQQVKDITRLTYDAGTAVGKDFRITTNGAESGIHSIFTSGNADRRLYSSDGIGVVTIEFTKSAFVTKIDYKLYDNFDYLRLEGSNDSKNWKRLLSLSDLSYNWDTSIETELLSKGYFKFYRFIMPANKRIRSIGLHGFYADDYEQDFEKVSPKMSSVSNGGVTISYTSQNQGSANNITYEGTDNYFYCSTKETDGTAFIQYAFEQAVLVNFIDVGFRDGYADQIPSHWKIVVSNDGETWVTLVERQYPTYGNTGETHQFYLNNSTAYKIYRFVSVVDSGWFTLARFRLYYIHDYTEIGAPYGLDTHVPKLNSASENGYVVTCSSEDSSSGNGASWRAFNGASNDWWSTTQGQAKNCWISLEFPSATVCNAVSIMTMDNGDYRRGPGFFYIQASNDGEDWDILATKTASWSQGEQKLFEFENSTAYLHYRLFILNNEVDDNSYTDISELNWGQVLRNPRRRLIGVTSLVPVMAGDTQDGYVIEASSNYSASESVWHAFDGNKSTLWSSTASAIPATVTVTLPEAKVCDGLMLMSRSRYYNQTPLGFIVQGSQDKESWVDLYRCSTQNTWTQAYEKRTYSFDNTTAYLYYRLYVTSVNNNDNAVSASEIQFLKSYDIEEY